MFDFNPYEIEIEEKFVAFFIPVCIQIFLFFWTFKFIYGLAYFIFLLEINLEIFLFIV